MEGGDLNKKDGASRIVGESSSSYKERDEIKKKDGEGRLFADNKGKGPWVQKPRYFGGEVGGFSWPPRSYACSFCRREFRSAQALGGHMNVHRRDRARLRQSPPWVAQTSNPNFSTSNPFNLPPSTPPFPASHHSSQTCFISTSPSSSSSGQVKISDLAAPSVHPRRRNTLSALFDIEAQDSRDFQVGGHRSDILKRREIVSLDLEIGLNRDSKDDLDLELRLGHT